jgi:putative oxidoreductase
MLTHGLPKLARLFGGGDIKFADPIGIGMTASLILVVLAEAFCSIFIALGFATRVAAFILVINMAVVLLISLWNEPFSKKELPLLYLLIYVTLLVMGAGKYSIDQMISKKA